MDRRWDRSLVESGLQPGYYNGQAKLMENHKEYFIISQELLKIITKIDYISSLTYF